MALATGALKGLGQRADRGKRYEGYDGGLMLARMKTLEEGFAEVVREFRGHANSGEKFGGEREFGWCGWGWWWWEGGWTMRSWSRMRRLRLKVMFWSGI
jgi:hypothetical protein